MSKRGKAAKYEGHDFYCINCGNKGINIMRKVGQLHGKGHRKKLYCIYCKTEVNHVECRTMEEVEDFKSDFEKGAFIDEAKESLLVGRITGKWQINLG